MSRKEGYVPAEEARVQAKEKAKHRASLQVRGGGSDDRSYGFGFVEAGIEIVGERAGAIVAEEVEESRLTEYVNRCLANIDLARQRMSNDQIEIDRLREETRSLISDLMIA